MNTKNNRVYQLTLSALLCAIGIAIPLVSPLKIVLEPASFTLASHVAIFIAMFISLPTAFAVALGTTFGFFITGFPLVVVLRAATHVIFASVGALLLEKRPNIFRDRVGTQFFGIGIGMIHSITEVLVVIPFYLGDHLSGAYYDNGFVTSVLLLVGVGSLIHSIIDYNLSILLWRILKKTLKPAI